jgi:hypothetical protein
VLTIGGVFIHREAGEVRVVAPLVAVTVRRTRRSVDDRPEERPDARVEERPDRPMDAGTAPGSSAPPDASP